LVLEQIKAAKRAELEALAATLRVEREERQATEDATQVSPGY
jgi:hypothetical protein